ncbi:VOC family protein [Sandarakinorhabdus sp. AAP62]|uniref:VOC family protein n=1 Tax=Sandarakinorhabdus sp. AAP62 TaxID=1248916 RepID=UPI00031200FC|nr:VOC family protein [Sandarakinorhabdus sp. AAP62]
MDQRISIVTLGTDDMARAVAFWEAMGWPRKARKFDAIAMFQCGGLAFALYPFDKLAEDCGMTDRGAVEGGAVRRRGFGGFTLAHNVRSKAEVDALLARAVANGATLQKPAHDAFWGGYSGYFCDPDGHPWEVVYNPFMLPGPDGSVTLAD